MMTYILLRNNKESAPLALDEIRNAGLKAHDLVWVEGQSVCWQDPAEIRELKDYINMPVKVVAPELPADEPKKDTPVKEDISRFLPAEEENGSISIDEPLPAAEIIFPNNQGTYKLKESIPPEIHYSQPLDELKQLYAKRLAERKKKGLFYLQVTPQLKKAGLYAGILVIGVVAGILINNSGKKKDTLSVQDLTASKPAVTNDQTILPEQTTVADSTVLITVPNNPSRPEEIQYTEKEMNESPAKQPARKEQAPETIAEKKVLPPLTEDPKPKNEEESRTNKELSLTEMRSMVQVATNDYIVGSFGGIRDLQLTVTNNSKYNLDHVVVELRYLKPRDEFLKADNISFYSIAPNDSKTVAIPKSTRGVKVSYKIIRIESKEASTAGL